MVDIVQSSKSNCEVFDMEKVNENGKRTTTKNGIKC